MTSDTLKQRFVDALRRGEIGRVTDDGIIVTLKEFKAHFSYIKTQYIDSYLPSVTFEAGQHTLTHTRFMFRVRKGVYRVHPELLLVKEHDKNKR